MFLGKINFNNAEFVHPNIQDNLPHNTVKSNITMTNDIHIMNTHVDL